MTQTDPQSLLALDVGTKRIGVAVASLIARLPRPLMTLPAGDGVLPKIAELVKDEAAAGIVVGLPRGLQGQRTDQTGLTEQFIAALRQHITIPIYIQDEALTSYKAKNELADRRKGYNKGEVDALAAAYILEDYLKEAEYRGTHG